MADQFDEFLNEVEQDIRHAKYERLWKQYGKQATYAAGALLGLVALYTMWTHHEEKKRLQISEAYIRTQNLIDSGKTDEAIHALETLAQNNHKAYATLSLFTLAGIRASEGPYQDIPQAITLYKRIAQDTRSEPYQRDFALVRAITLEIGQDTTQDNPTALKAALEQLEPLCKTDAPWKLMALETKAIILSQLKDPQAAEVFVSIAQDPNCPEAMRSRAQIMARSQNTPH
jgi:hypothetical protein